MKLYRRKPLFSQSKKDKELRNAIKRKNITAVKDALKNGANPSHNDNVSFELALINNAPEIGKILLSHNIDPNGVINSKESYLMYAVNKHMTEFVRILAEDNRCNLEFGGYVFINDNKSPSISPLTAAEERCYMDIAFIISKTMATRHQGMANLFDKKANAYKEYIENEKGLKNYLKNKVPPKF